MIRLILVVAAFTIAAPGFAGPTAANPSLMGSPVLTPTQRANFLHNMNPRVDLTSAINLSLLYDEEAQVEGVNPDWAFAQMLLETSFLRYGGQVSSSQNNFAGLGALDTGEQGQHFSSPRLGVRAQVQLLKYYASVQPLAGHPVISDRPYLKRGGAPTVFGLARSWASDPDYGAKLVSVMDRMLAYAHLEPSRTP